MNIGLALFISFLAGISTCIGSVLSLFYRKPGPRFMTLTLGFSAGVMVFVAFVELLQTGIHDIGFLKAQIAFFAGIFLMFLIDVLIPHNYLSEKMAVNGEKQINLARTGLLVAMGICIHNFPEGIATFVGALQGINLGISIAIAIALHNIPEGIAVAVTIYAATHSRKKAFYWSFFSGMAEPLGAVIAALFLMPFLSPALLGYVLSVVAGIMLFIAVDELLPTSRAYGHEHISILGFVFGMLVMSLSLWLLAV